MREIVLDTETTGLDPAAGHRLVEIGCVELIQGLRSGKTFHAYINPERDMPPEAERVHGISAEFLKDKPLFRDIERALVEFLADSTLIIHNASFDMKFLNYELKNIGQKALSMDRVIDTVELARKKYPGQPANLDALCRRFNIDLSMRTKHGALLDAELLADVYLELTGGRQSSLVLEEDAAISTDQTVSITNSATPRPARHFKASEEEKQRHQNFIAQIKDAIWLKSRENVN